MASAAANVMQVRPDLKEEDVASDDDKPLGQLGKLKTSVENGAKREAKVEAGAAAASNGEQSKQQGRGMALKREREEEDSDDELPLVRRRSSQEARPGVMKAARAEKAGVSGEKRAPAVAKVEAGSSGALKGSPAAVRGNGSAAKRKAEREVESSEEESEEEEEEEEEESEEESEEEDLPLSQRSVQKSSASSAMKGGIKRGEGQRGGGAGKKAKAEVKKPRKKEGDTSEKWKTLQHSGVIFPPLYTPHGIKILYAGKPVDLTPEQEEVATMFAVMRETDYMTKPVFLKNFWNDWKQLLGPKHVIQKLELCDFTPIWEWHLQEKEKKKQMTSEEKKKLKEEKMKVEEKYMWAVIDGVKEKVGNFRVEPPGLFRGRGEHPKMGKLKRRIWPEDIVINIGKEAPVPESPLPGHRWKEIRHDRTVTWLAYWYDPINSKEFKYVFLAASSSLKGQSDMQKYEKARMLKDHIKKIRETYTRNFGSKDEQTRQIAVATYLIDRLALRAGNEKDDDEADTVGCCSLKVEHVKQVPPSSLEFDFLGKDSIRYFNTVEVEPAVFKAMGDFRKGKKAGDDVFDKIDTSTLNARLKEIMPSLTAKVFRTYNASITLDNLLQDTTGSTVLEKIASYQRANKEVAILCNHQRSVPKGHSSQMEKMETRMAECQKAISDFEEDLERVRKGKAPIKRDDSTSKKTPSAESLEKKLAQAKSRLEKMKIEMAVKDDLKTVALGTSKINYMDPRITVAWCKLHDVPIEKVFNKSLLAKFTWAMDVSPQFRF